MKRIKILNAAMEVVEHGMPVLGAALEAINGRAYAWTISTPEQVIDIARRAEAQLAASGLLRAQRGGVRLEYLPAGQAASRTTRSRGYYRRTTRVVLERSTAGWYVVEIQRAEVVANAPERLKPIVTAQQAAEIQRRALLPYEIGLSRQVHYVHSTRPFALAPSHLQDQTMHCS